MSDTFQTILSYFNIDKELENHDVIHQEIQKGVIFKGTNLWILVFAIGIASVGLNMNSTAVIIGAMLISPLMGPINGMGYSIATYDFDLLRLSIKNFTFAVVASLITSTLYFAISPISTAHSELLARTSPTIYDVLIALLGGLSGIFAISSKLKGNVIPGVAIATALMPPLCTAGYGLATGQFDFFFGAFYLFTINTVFIALASVIVSQVLKFPIRAAIEGKQKTKINRIISTVIALVLLPSIYFGYLLVEKEKFTENAKSFINSVQSFNGLYLLSHKIDDKKHEIELIYGGTEINEETKELITEGLTNFNLKKTKVSIKNRLKFNGLNNDLNNSEIQNLKVQLLERDKELQAYKIESGLGEQLMKEIKVTFPIILGVSLGSITSFEANQTKLNKIALVKLTEDMDLQEDRNRFEKWLKVRLNDSNIQIIFE